MQWLIQGGGDTTVDGMVDAMSGVMVDTRVDAATIDTRVDAAMVDAAC